MKKKPPPLDDPRPKRNRRRNSFLPLAIGMSGGVVLATAAFWFFRKQAERVVAGEADHYDNRVLEYVGRADHPAVNRVMKTFTMLGTHAAVGTAAGLTAIALMRKGRQHDAWTIVISTSGAMALNTILKAMFQRNRPHELYRHIRLPRSHSFPSGHSLLAAATYPILAHHLVEKLPTRVQIAGHSAAALLILGIGFSRIYFAVHFPSDVLAGFAAGSGWLGLTSLTHTMIDRDLM